MKRGFQESVLNGQRLDGRKLDEIRPISCDIGILPESVHGSAVFRRGDTHVLSAITLGPRGDSRVRLPAVGGEDKNDSFYLHYDFPPYSVGEVGSSTIINRRMIGHGNLAERAVKAVIPAPGEFPYTIRAFCEVTSSSGSSSMASSTAACLGLLDAGVPLKALVAGVSIGLAIDPQLESSVNEDHIGDNYQLVTDIIGSEDHYGYMDLKVAGTKAGVTALQMDVKVAGGIPLRILDEALKTAETGRKDIINTVEVSLEETANGRMSLQSLGYDAHQRDKSGIPKAAVVYYKPEKKSNISGSGGDMKRAIENTYVVTIDLSVEEEIYIFGKDKGVEKAKLLVQDLVEDFQVGDQVSGKVVELRDYGATVRLSRAQDALLHMSEVSHDSAVNRRPLDEVLYPGQILDLLITAVDVARGSVKVSRKALLSKDKPDALRSTKIASSKILEELEDDGEKMKTPTPKFPLQPPRKWDRHFFKSNAADADDVSAVVFSTKKVKNETGKKGEGSKSSMKEGNKQPGDRKKKKKFTTMKRIKEEVGTNKGSVE